MAGINQIFSLADDVANYVKACGRNSMLTRPQSLKKGDLTELRLAQPLTNEIKLSHQIVKERLLNLVAKNEFLQTPIMKTRFQSFIKQTEGDYELLEKILNNKILFNNSDILQSVLHSTNNNNKIILTKYLNQELKYLNGNKEQLINEIHLNSLIQLNRNNQNVSELINSSSNVTNFIRQTVNIGKQFTTDIQGQNQIMNVLCLGSINGKGTPAVLNKNLLDDFENLVHGKSYYPQLTAKNVNNSLTKIKAGTAFSVDGIMYVKECDDKITKLGYTQDVFEKLFPAVERFNICQGRAGDCFFLSPLNSLMEIPQGRTAIYKMFRGSTNEKIVISTARTPNEQYVFKNFDNIGYHSKNENGLSILEQYQAVCDFGEGLNPILNERKNMGYIMRNFAGIPSIGDNFESFAILSNVSRQKANNINELKSLLKQLNNERVINFGTKSGAICKEADIIGGHVYAVKGFNADTEIVTIANPWHGGIESSISLKDLDKYVKYNTPILVNLT